MPSATEIPRTLDRSDPGRGMSSRGSRTQVPRRPRTERPTATPDQPVGDTTSPAPAVPAPNWWQSASYREAELNVDDVRLEDAIQCRADGLNETAVQEYAELVRNGTSLPRIVMIDDGTCARLVDGFHRLEAARRAGHQTLEARIYDGDALHALVYATGANAQHGLRRSIADKQMAVRRLLEHPSFTSVSSRHIANSAGVSHTMVDSMRAELQESGTIPRTEKVMGSDGRAQSPVKRPEGDSGGKLCHPDQTTQPPHEQPVSPSLEAATANGPGDARTEAALESAWTRAEDGLRAIDCSQDPPATWDSLRRHNFGQLIVNVCTALMRESQ